MSHEFQKPRQSYEIINPNEPYTKRQARNFVDGELRLAREELEEIITHAKPTPTGALEYLSATKIGLGEAKTSQAIDLGELKDPIDLDLPPAERYPNTIKILLIGLRSYEQKLGAAWFKPDKTIEMYSGNIQAFLREYASTHDDGELSQLLNYIESTNDSPEPHYRSSGKIKEFIPEIFPQKQSIIRGIVDAVKNSRPNEK